MFPLSTPLPLKNYLYYPKKRDVYRAAIFIPLQKSAKVRTMKLQRRFANMKKARIIAVMAALIVSLSGCANTNYPQAIQDSSGIETVTSETYEHTEPEESSSVSVSGSKESAANGTATVQAETESAQAENSQPIAEQSPAQGTQSPQTAVPNNTPKSETPKTVEPTPEPEPAPTQQPTPPPCGRNAKGRAATGNQTGAGRTCRS